MAQIVLIDDDPVEAMVLGGLLEHAEGGHRLESFTSVEAFIARRGLAADLVLLDRRIPPHVDFASSLAAFSASDYDGPIVLITAGLPDAGGLEWRGGLHGPVDKSSLLTPQAVSALIGAVLG